MSAFTIGMGYFLGGLIPLLPYFFIARAHVALLWSCLVTGIILLIFGAVKAHVTGASQGYVWGAVTTLLVGGAAAGAAYGIVKLLEGGS
jgi:vacuolar iron transporter family protein